MQEEGSTVTFQPIYEGHTAWFTKIFALYAFVALIIMAVRLARVLLNARGLSRLLENEIEIEGRDPSSLLSEGFSEVRLLKNLAIVTFLASVLELSLDLSQILWGVRTEKALNFSYLLPEIGDAFTPFSFGITVTILLYVSFIFSQSILERRKRVFERSAGNNFAIGNDARF
jgi:hypothetical protein